MENVLLHENTTDTVSTVVLMNSNPLDVLDLQLFMEIVGILVYCYVIYVLMTSKSTIFRSSFYIFFVVAGFFDIPMAAASAFLRANKHIGLCQPWEFLIRFASSITGLNFIVHVLLNLLMNLNRFSAVQFPTKHEQIWSKLRCVTVILVCIIGSAICSYSLFLNPFIILKISDGRCQRAGRQEDPQLVRIVSGSCVVLFEGVCLILSPLTIWNMIKLKRQYPGKKMKETSLAFFSLIHCIAFSFELIYEIVNMLKIPVEEYVLLKIIEQKFTLYFYFLVIFNGPTLIMLSPTLRKEIVSRWSNEPATSVVSLPSSPNYIPPKRAVFQISIIGVGKKTSY